MSQYDLTDFEWRMIEPLPPNKPRGVPRVDGRCVLNGILGAALQCAVAGPVLRLRSARTDVGSAAFISRGLAPRRRVDPGLRRDDGEEG